MKTKIFLTILSLLILGLSLTPRVQAETQTVSETEYVCETSSYGEETCHSKVTTKETEKVIVETKVLGVEKTHEVGPTAMDSRLRLAIYSIVGSITLLSLAAILRIKSQI